MQTGGALSFHGCGTSINVGKLFAAILAHAAPCLERVPPDHNALRDRLGVLLGDKVGTHLQAPLTMHSVLKIGSASTWQGLVLGRTGLCCT
jgi:hypothetical protein